MDRHSLATKRHARCRVSSSRSGAMLASWGSYIIELSMVCCSSDSEAPRHQGFWEVQPEAAQVA